MTALNAKARRDLVALAGQVATIALVIGCGIASYVSFRGCWKSLDASRDLYFERYRFGDAFVHLSVAPESVAGRLEEVPGVALVMPRLVEPMRVPLADMVDPARGWVVSLPRGGVPPLDALWVREGRLPEPDHDDEAVVLNSFAKAHGIGPGQSLPVVMNGRAVDLRVVGIADTPEFLASMAPGEIMPDPARFAVIWTNLDAVASAYGMEGSFDDVVLRLQPGADEPGVIAALDRELAPYGGAGAHVRADHMAQKFLEQEMGQLASLATSIPIVFLGVAAFLLQVALARIVQTQRTSIATLKAFGYRRSEIAMHYFGLVSAVAVLGALLGVGAGAWVGQAMTALYATFFHLPLFVFHLDPEVLLVALGVSVGAAILGTFWTVRQVVLMAPAEAMQPPVPPSYSRSLVERAGLLSFLNPASRMVARDLIRRPHRLAISVAGIAAATGVVVLGRFSSDAVVALQDLMFVHSQAEDVAVTFANPVAPGALSSLRSLPGVTLAEGQRTVGVRFRHGPVWRDGALFGHPADPHLRRVMSWPMASASIPASGVILDDILADILGVKAGDDVEVEALYGDHRSADVRVQGVVSEAVGLSGHVSLVCLGDILGEPTSITEAYLSVEPESRDEVVARLAQMPGVLGASLHSAVVARFEQQVAESRDFFMIIATAFGAAMAIGIVYNNVRIALSVRARDLASLRVLGFTRTDVTTMVLGEQAVQIVLGVPVGLWAGGRMAAMMMRTVDPETWRFPVMISPQTYGFSAMVVIVSAVVCVGLVQRRVARLDLVAVLKTRE